MDPTPMEVTIALMPVLMLLGLVVLAAMWIWRRGKNAEMQHRERMAMIEKGLMPPSETAETMRLADALDERQTRESGSVGLRQRSIGITFVGLGFALMLVISLTGGSPEAGIGIGGAVAVLGAAQIVNSYLSGRDASRPARERVMTSPPGSPPAP